MLLASLPTCLVAIVSLTTYILFFFSTSCFSDLLPQIGEITIMKEMTKAATNMMTDEEKAEVEKQLNQQYNPNGGASGALSPQSISHEPHIDTSTSAAGSSPAVTPTPTTGTSSPATVSAPTTTTSTSPEDLAAQKAALRERQRQQREKMRAQDEERRREMKERVKTLTAKLIERLRPYVEAKNPGDPNDPETVSWMKKIGKEAEDLKLESFGVELLQTIGHVYATKGTTYLKSQKMLGM